MLLTVHGNIFWEISLFTQQRTLIINCADTRACSPADRKWLTHWPISHYTAFNGLFMHREAAVYLPAYGANEEMSSDARRRTVCSTNISQPETCHTAPVVFMRIKFLCWSHFFLSNWQRLVRSLVINQRGCFVCVVQTNYRANAQSHSSECSFREAAGQQRPVVWLDDLKQHTETSPTIYLFY